MIQQEVVLPYHAYRQTSNITHALVGNNIVDHSNVVGPSLVGAQRLQLHLHSRLDTWLQWIGQTITRRGERHLSFGIWCDFY